MGQIVVISEYHQAYSTVAEALVALLFPLVWEFPFISVTPVQLIGVAESPVPFIVGVHIKVRRSVCARRCPGSSSLHAE